MNLADENVEFIAISINDEMDYWNKYLSEKNIFTSEFWIGNKENTPLHSMTYSVEEIDGMRIPLVSLPTFTFIDPDGKIIARNFTRPSNPEFENDLKVHLNNDH